MTQQTEKFLQFSKIPQPQMLKICSSQSPQKLIQQIKTYTPSSLSKINLKQSHESNDLVAMKIQKRPDHRCCYILTISIVVLITIFCIDVYHEKKIQMSTGQIIRRQCYEDYQENECLNPVDVLKDKCRQLQICYSLNSKQNIGILETAAKIIGKTVNSLLSHTTIFGAILLIVIMAGVLLFAFKSNSSQQIKVIYKNKNQ